MNMTFHKYHGAGNDFIIVDNRRNVFHIKGLLKQAMIAGMCHRHYGVGADGFILLQRGKKADFRMEYYNADGREGSLCGNGARCIVAFAHQKGIIKTRKTVFDTVDGLHEAEIVEIYGEKYIVSVGLKDAIVEERINKKEYLVNTGSPHLVIFTEKLPEIDVNLLGKERRNAAEFAPDGLNVNFVQLVDKSTLSIRTFERGVERETLSCGTGIAAAALAYSFYQEENSGQLYSVNTSGGTMEVKFDAHSGVKGAFTGIKLIGPAQYVFKGSVRL